MKSEDETKLDKPTYFIGTSRKDLLSFPRLTIFNLGTALRAVQTGMMDAIDWKPLTRVGSGTLEIREKSENGIFRMIAVAKFPECVYVLHCFQKKDQEIREKDVQIAQDRYKVMLKLRNEERETND